MKKMISTLFIVSIFGLLVNFVHAEDIASSSHPNSAIANSVNRVEPAAKLIEVSNWDFNSKLPYVLQQDHKACIDKCSQDHSSCMSQAGGNPTAVNNCDEKRWRCTLGCDDKYYGLTPIDSFNLY